jgi:hypothetical protein
VHRRPADHGRLGWRMGDHLPQHSPCPRPAVLIDPSRMRKRHS